MGKEKRASESTKLLDKTLKAMIATARIKGSEKLTFSAQNVIDWMEKVALSKDTLYVIKDRTTIYKNTRYKEMIEEAKAKYYEALQSSTDVSWPDDMDAKLLYQEVVYKLELSKRENAALRSTIEQASIQELETTERSRALVHDQSEGYADILKTLLNICADEGRIVVSPPSRGKPMMIFYSSFDGEKKICNFSEVEDVFDYVKDKDGIIMLTEK